MKLAQNQVYQQGAEYIRTHAPGALKDGLKVLKTIGQGR